MEIIMKGWDSRPMLLYKVNGCGWPGWWTDKLELSLNMVISNLNSCIFCVHASVYIILLTLAIMVTVFELIISLQQS